MTDPNEEDSFARDCEDENTNDHDFGAYEGQGSGAEYDL